MYALSWHPGQENLVYYQSKHHTGAHHIAVCPWYLHIDNSPQELPRALAPSALKGLFNLFCFIGPPAILQADNGGEFNGMALDGKARKVIITDEVSRHAICKNTFYFYN
jgi:hypothetical protein